jgi:hypothetical protein
MTRGVDQERHAATRPAHQTVVMGLFDRVRRTSESSADDGTRHLGRIAAFSLGGRIPGPVVPFGEHAFCIASGRVDGADQSIVAAAEMPNGGRVVALGHDGLFGAAESDRSVRDVLAALLEWAGNGAETTMIRHGAPAEHVARSAGVRINRTARVAIVSGNALDNDDDLVEQLAAMVNAGGGVIVDSTPWGWLQLHDATLREGHGANRLVRRFGLCFADGMVEPSLRGESYRVTDHDDDVHGAAALRSFESGRASRTATETLINLSDVLAFDDPVRTQLRGVAGAIDPFSISPSKPVRSDDHRARLAAQLWIADWSPTALDDPHLQLSVLDSPGLTTTTTVPAGRPGWISTGLYADAGERITVRLLTPHATAIDSVFDAGVRIRIGAQTDQLWHAKEWKRFPDVATATVMSGEVVTAANPFGGLIYLDLDAASMVPIEFEITGGRAAPRFVLGSTMPEQWSSARSLDAPWAEIEGKRFVLTVPSWATRTLSDPVAVCAYWDEVLGRCHELAGVADRIRPERYVCDVQISHGYLHAGYPVMGHDDIAGIWADPNRLRAYDWNAAWALFHETGHNFQEDWWTFDGTVEVTCNWFSLYCAEMVHGRRDDAHPSLRPARQQASGFKRRGTFEQWKDDPFLALDSYRELIDRYGWDALKAVIASYRDPSFGPTPTSDDDARDQFAIRYSAIVGRDLSGHFDEWSIPISAAAHRRCAARA